MFAGFDGFPRLFSRFSAVFSPGFFTVFTGFHRSLPVFTGFYRFSPVSPGFYRFLLVVTFLPVFGSGAACGLQPAQARVA